MKSRIVVGAVICRAGKVLILRRSGKEPVYPGLWELPSGKQEENESREMALMREVKEETGLDVIPERIISRFEYSVVKNSKKKKTVQVNFLAAVQQDSVVSLSSEHDEFVWINKSELDSFNISDQTKAVIKEALKN